MYKIRGFARSTPVSIAPMYTCVPSNDKDLEKKINKKNKAEERGKREISNYN